MPNAGMDSRKSDKRNDYLDYLESIAALMPGNFYWKDQDSGYLGCNQALLKTLDLPKAGIVGKTDYDLWPSQAEGLIQHDKQVMATGKLLKLEEQVEIGGKKRYYTVIKIPLKNKRGKIVGIIGNSLDITTQVELNQALIQEKKRVNQALKVKSDFIANMSHDIRTPITGMLGLIQVIIDETKDDSILSYAKLLMGCTDELLNLLNEIIEVIKVDKLTERVHQETFNLMDLITHNVNLIKPAAEHLNNNIQIVYPIEKPKILFSNRIYIDRIILNLLSNAIKFTDQGEIKICVDFEAIEGNNIYLILKIIDTGIGIPEEKFDTIFENFSKLSPSYHGIYKGSGLGLYMVKELVQALRGRIEVQSQLGKGSTFTVYVPIVIKENKILDKTLHQDARDFNISSSAFTVLLVEDNILAAKAAEALLKKNQIAVEIADSGKEAIRLFKSKYYNFVLMDVGLPDIDGIQVTQMFRAFEKDREIKTPIIGLTGHLSDEIKLKCLDAGMNAVFNKPLKPQEAEKIKKEYAINYLDNFIRDTSD